MTTIHTGNTTTTGFVVTSDNSGDLVLKTGGSGGTTAATFDGTTQQATFNAPVSQPGAFMFRNKIINGNFDIWQRGTSQTSSGYGSADRWVLGLTGTSDTMSRQTFTLGQTDVPNNPKYFMRHVVTTSAGASNYALVNQRIESVETFSGQTVTLSFWAKADASKNIAVEFMQYFGTGGSPSTQVDTIGSQLIALTTSWAKYTVSVSIPSVSGKTLGSNANDWLGLVFWLDAGSDYDSRTASLGQQSGTFDIAQVQIEEGSAATPFEMRPIQIESNLCYRYYLENIALAGTGYATGTGQTERAMASCVFPTELRTSSWTTSWTQSGGSNNQTGALGVIQRTALSAVFSEASNASGSQFWRGYVDIDAEL